MPKQHTPSIDLVREFHKVFKHPVAEDVSASDAKNRRLRVALIAEELGELAVALGVPLKLEVVPFNAPDGSSKSGMASSLWVAPEALCSQAKYVDLVETADALGDLDYVVQGSNLVFGIPGGLVLEAIHESNMSKLGADGQPIWDVNGKVVKGPNYHKPDIKTLLEGFDRAEEL